MKNKKKKLEPEIKLLDCTLRDGGYYNNWNFSKSEIQNYINSIYSTGIKYVELGFRFNEKRKIKGLTAYTDKFLIKKLKLPKPMHFGIMINAGNLISKNKFNLEILKKLVNNKNTQKLNFVRLACHEKEIFYLSKCFKYLKKNNLRIFVNLMQISEINFNSLRKILTFLKKNKVKNLYLADSLGCLTPNQLQKIIFFIKKEWNFEIGLHAHNNLNKALTNSLLAIKNDVKWIDSTITGMGRGPGNLRTENIIKYSKNHKFTKKFFNNVSFFQNLKKKYKWGPNKYYKFAAIKKIHPTYIQKILSDKRYKKSEYLEILYSLSKFNTRLFNPNKLVNSSYFLSGNAKGSWSPKQLIKNRDILILGPGKNLQKNKSVIEKIVKKRNLFVISLNTFSSINESLINLRVICHPLRMTSDKIKLKKLKSRFVIPFTSFTRRFRKSINISKKNTYDFGISLIEKNQVLVKKNSCVLPYPLAIGYALSITIAGMARTITLAGFDGYDKSDSQSDNTDEIINLFYKRYFNKKISSLTKTKYKFLIFRR